MRRLLPPLGLFALLLACWEVWVRARDTPHYVLPPPSSIWSAFGESRSLLGAHVLTTAYEAGLGLVIGALLGVGLAVLIAASTLVRQVVYPLIVASQTIPMIILAPLLVLWFGFGLVPKVVVVALITFFPVTVATVGGLASAAPEHIELIRSMGAGRRAVIRHVLVPSALPSLFDGLRIAAAYTVAGAVIAEWTGAERGIGIFIERSQSSFRVDQVFVGVVIVALLTTLLFALIGLAGRAAAPWYYRRRATERTASAFATLRLRRAPPRPAMTAPDASHSLRHPTEKSQR